MPKKALISPNEKILKKYFRVTQIEDKEFEVAPPLFWIDCDDNIKADNYVYDNENNLFIERASLFPSSEISFDDLF